MRIGCGRCAFLPHDSALCRVAFAETQQTRASRVLYHVKLPFLFWFEKDESTETDLPILHFRQGTQLCFFCSGPEVLACAKAGGGEEGLLVGSIERPVSDQYLLRVQDCEFRKKNSGRKAREAYCSHSLDSISFSRRHSPSAHVVYR